MLQMSLFGEAEEIPKTPIEILKSQPAPDARSPVVVSYGGGRNSTAMLILCQRLGIKVDLILFADTGGEKPETYEYLEIFDQWLTKNGMPSITIVRRRIYGVSETRKALSAAKRSFYYCLLKNPSLDWIDRNPSFKLLFWLIWLVGVASHPFTTLEEKCLTTQTLPSVAYGHKSCSVQYKIEPQEEYLEQWEKGAIAIQEGIKIRKLIGYHAREVQRLIDKKTKMMRPLEDDLYRYEYPLMTYGVDNFASMAIIASANLPVPPKSSCFFCPSSIREEVRSLPPELRARAELIEQVAKDGVHWQNNDSVKGLGRNFAWSELDKLTELEQALIDLQRESQSCHCID